MLNTGQKYAIPALCKAKFKRATVIVETSSSVVDGIITLRIPSQGEPQEPILQPA